MANIELILTPASPTGSMVFVLGAPGPQGIQGIQGEKGDKGDQGDPGTPGTTIDAWTAPLAFNSGTKTAYIDPNGNLTIAGITTGQITVWEGVAGYSSLISKNGFVAENGLSEITLTTTIAGLEIFNSSTNKRVKLRCDSGLTFPDATVQATKGLIPASNLSDVPSKPTARTNLGLGSIATYDSSDYAVTARGLPSGGSTAQVLAKSSGSDYAVEWVAVQGDFLPLSGGAMNTGAEVTIADGSNHDSELAGWGLGVELSDDHAQGTTVEFNGLNTYDSAGHMIVNPTGLTFPDSTVQTTAWTGSAESYLPLAGGSMSGNINFDGSVMTVASSGITFPDSTIQTTAWSGSVGDYRQLSDFDFTNASGYVQLVTYGSQIVPNAVRPAGGAYIVSDRVQLFEEITGIGVTLNPAGMYFINPNGSITSGTIQYGRTSITFDNGSIQTTAGLPLTGGTLSGKLNLAAPTAGGASLNLGVGTAPTTSVAGDIWIATNINFKDSAGTLKVVANTSTANTFTQPQIISTGTSATLPALRVTNQSTTAVSLIVEDTTNPDVTSLVIDASGNLGVGTAIGYTATQKVEVIGNVKADAFINGSGPTYKVNAIQAHSGGSDTHELVVSVGGSTYRIGMKFVSTP